MLLMNIVSMIGAMQHDARRPGKPLAQLERDAALARIVRARRWVIAGAAALTAGCAALVSAIAPGKTLGARAHARVLGSTRTPVHRATATQMPPLASAGDLGLRGPSQAPQSAPAASQASQAPSQAAPDASQATPSPSQATPDPSQATPAPASSGPAVVSGGS
jgi:hypothetical protein